MAIKMKLTDEDIKVNHEKEKISFEKMVNSAQNLNNQLSQTFTNNLLLLNTVMITASFVILGAYIHKNGVTSAFIISEVSLNFLAILSAGINSFVEQNFASKKIKENQNIVSQLQMVSDNQSIEYKNPQEIDALIKKEYYNNKTKPSLFWFYAQTSLTLLSVLNLVLVAILLIFLK